MSKIIDVLNKKDKIHKIEFNSNFFYKKFLSGYILGIMLSLVFVFCFTMLYKVNRLESELKNLETIELLCNGDCLVSPEIIKYMETYCHGCVLEEEDME